MARLLLSATLLCVLVAVLDAEKIGPISTMPSADKFTHACLKDWIAGPVNCTGATLLGIDFSGAYLPNSRFDQAYLAHASFKGKWLYLKPTTPNKKALEC